LKLNLFLLRQLLPVTRKVSDGSYLSQTYLSAHKMLVYSIHISKGSAATRLRCGGIFKDSFITNFFVCQWKNYRNRSIFGKDMEKSLVAHFLWLTV